MGGSTRQRNVERGGPDRRSVLRGAAFALGGVLLGGLFDLGTLRGARADSDPLMYTRADWRARQPRLPGLVLNRRPDRVVVHHTATPNVADHSREQAFALSRSIQDHHMWTNGWSDSGQQFTVSRGGFLMEGRDNAISAVLERRHLLGAHVVGHNSHTVGIENEGDYTSARPPDRLLDTLVDTCAWLCLVYDLDPGRAIVGHRDFTPTDCPGDRLYAMLPQLRAATAARLSRLREALARVGADRTSPLAPHPFEEYPPSRPELSVRRWAIRYHRGQPYPPGPPHPV